jgi:kynurenine formamidase
MAVGSPSVQEAIFAPLHGLAGDELSMQRKDASRTWLSDAGCPPPSSPLHLARSHSSAAKGVAVAARRKEAPMQFVDLSREIHHRTPAHPSHPPVVMAVWNDHGEVKTAGKTRFTSKSMALTLSDHSATHVDAPCHFNPDPKAASIDEVPLENFYTEAICLDLSHVPLKHQITVSEMEEALKASGQQIKKRDTVLIDMGVNKRLWGTTAYLHDFPGLHVDAVHWLADKGILMFGVEAVSPAPEGEPNFKAHMACAERGITHMECLWNLDKLVGKGRFRFVGFPLKIRGGTASPIRAVAIIGG